MSNNLQESVLPCVFFQTDAWCKGEWPQFGIQVPSQCEFTFQAKRASRFSGQKGIFYLLSVFVVYSSWFSLVFTMNPPVSWASSSMLLVCSHQALPDFWVSFLCSCQVPRLQPPFAASGHLLLWLRVTPVQTFSLVVGPHGKGHQNIFGDALHLWGHQIMHAFHDLENIRLLSTKCGTSWETHMRNSQTRRREKPKFKLDWKSCRLLPTQPGRWGLLLKSKSF